MPLLGGFVSVAGPSIIDEMTSVADNSSACFQAAASSIFFNAFAMAAFDAAVGFIQ